MRDKGGGRDVMEFIEGGVGTGGGLCGWMWMWTWRVTGIEKGMVEIATPILYKYAAREEKKVRRQ